MQREMKRQMERVSLTDYSHYWLWFPFEFLCGSSQLTWTVFPSSGADAKEDDEEGGEGSQADEGEEADEKEGGDDAGGEKEEEESKEAEVAEAEEKKEKTKDKNV